MKTTQTICLLAIALCIGFFAARWSQAQSTTNTSVSKPTTDDDAYMQEFLSLENYLNDSKQTNALKQLNDILSHNRAMERAVDMAITVPILQGLREGKTNEVLGFLENHLDMNICVFASEYRTLPALLKRQMSLKPLQAAQNYRVKFPFQSSKVYSEDITNAFKILDKGNSN
jgi:hypothetical protein